MKAKLIQKIYNLNDITNEKTNLFLNELNEVVVREFTGKKLKDYGNFIVILFENNQTGKQEEYHVYKKLKVFDGVYSWIWTALTQDEITKAGFDHPVLGVNIVTIE